MSLHSLPLFVRMDRRPVILLGDGAAAAAKRRLLERAGATIVGEAARASLAVVAIEDDGAAVAAVARLKARGLLVNAVDRPALCDFTWPAIVDRDPLLIAIGTGGASAGLAATLRQRLETMLPASLGLLVHDLHAARDDVRRRWPDPQIRRRFLAAAMVPGGALDPLAEYAQGGVAAWLPAASDVQAGELVRIPVRSDDPDDLTLRQARALAQADRVYHAAAVAPAILDRARADAVRIVADAAPVRHEAGLTVWMERA